MELNSQSPALSIVDLALTESADILIVDDQPTNLRLLTRVLSRGGFAVRQAISGKMALQAINAQSPDLIMLDIMMPEMNGYQVCEILKANPITANIPVIFLSALNDVFDKVKAFSVGAVDYISKPFQPQEVLARVRHQLTLQTVNRKISHLNSELEQQVEERTQQLAEVNQRLRQLALYDELTRLPNRALFMDHLENALKIAQAQPSYQFAVLFLDCDRFKVINDSLGHFVGDQLLKAIALRLQDTLPEVESLARLGGDEFAILLNPPSKADQATAIAERILRTFTQPFQLQTYEVYISASIGIAISNDSYTQPQQILRDADTAMYKAKKGHEPRCQVFEPNMHQKAFKFLQLETDLRKAIEQKALHLAYQPIVDLQTEKLLGFETLIRWQHPERGFVSPGEFIPLAEETGLILPLSQWILEAACQQFKQWETQQLTYPELTLSINLSARQFVEKHLLQQIDQVLEQVKLDPGALKFEITESLLLENQAKAQSLLEQLRERNISICLDDFGTGYSSLNYLRCFPIDTLKIDQSFIRRLDGNPENLGLIPVMINVAKNMDMTVVAEGIEMAEQLHLLRDLGCHQGQGYFFARPLNAEDAARFLRESH
ncbi:MAG: putative bifunctional diguanylate cyclase/phosphodiesterase [Microcoleaceae cyanobacterium]